MVKLKLTTQHLQEKKMKVYDLVSDTEQDEAYKPVETFQDVFNHIVNHLIVQNKSAAEYGGNCRYRVYSEDWLEARKCAVGCLISENNYHEIIEDSLANNAEVIEAIKKSNPKLIIDDKVTELFLLMQFVHDHLEPENWMYMSFLIWRDMNRFISYRINHGYENIEDFPEINEFDGQKELYSQMAKKMTLADITRTRNYSKPYVMRDMYLEQAGIDKQISPIEFFKQNRITFESLTKKYN